MSFRLRTDIGHSRGVLLLFPEISDKQTARRLLSEGTTAYDEEAEETGPHSAAKVIIFPRNSISSLLNLGAS